MAPETPVSEKIPCHQRRSKEAPDQGHHRQADVGDEGEASQGPTRLVELPVHDLCYSMVKEEDGSDIQLPASVDGCHVGAAPMQ